MKKKTKRPLTPEEELLKDYKKKLMREAFLKSFIVGLVSGFVLSIPVSVISFITVYNTLWIALVIFVLSTIGFTALSYFKYYRTNLMETAMRVDGVGLEERVVTMIEYADRDDALAKRQRADAREALKYVDVKQVKIPFPKIPFIILAVSALVGICLMVGSRVNVAIANGNPDGDGSDTEIVLPIETEEDKIIREMIEDLRKIIDEAKVKQEIKDKLNSMVDDLEKSIKPEDSTEVKIAKISETAQKIHKILQEELSKTTIAEQLQKYETTKDLGKAIATGKIDKIQAAFDKMYAMIEPMRAQDKYDYLVQTGKDILQALEDATIEPEEDKLAKALEDLANELLKLPPPPPDTGGEEEKGGEEIDQAFKDALDSAMDAIKDALEDQKEIEETDKNIQDALQDAMDKLDGDQDSDDEKKDEEEQEKPEGSGSAAPGDDGELDFWTVIDGKTPYTEVYKEYYEWAMDMLTNGNLTDSERRMIENYLSILNIENEDGD